MAGRLGGKTAMGLGAGASGAGRGSGRATAALFLAADEVRSVAGTGPIVDGGLSATCVTPTPAA